MRDLTRHLGVKVTPLHDRLKEKGAYFKVNSISSAFAFAFTFAFSIAFSFFSLLHNLSGKPNFSLFSSNFCYTTLAHSYLPLTNHFTYAHTRRRWVGGKVLFGLKETENNPNLESWRGDTQSKMNILWLHDWILYSCYDSTHPHLRWFNNWKAEHEVSFFTSLSYCIVNRLYSITLSLPHTFTRLITSHIHTHIHMHTHTHIHRNAAMEWRCLTCRLWRSFSWKGVTQAIFWIASPHPMSAQTMVYLSPPLLLPLPFVLLFHFLNSLSLLSCLLYIQSIDNEFLSFFIHDIILYKNDFWLIILCICVYVCVFIWVSYLGRLIELHSMAERRRQNGGGRHSHEIVRWDVTIPTWHSSA